MRAAKWPGLGTCIVIPVLQQPIAADHCCAPCDARKEGMEEGARGTRAKAGTVG